MVGRGLGALVLLALVFGCSPKATIQRDHFTPPEKRVLYVVPFTTVMVPGQVAETLFDRFVDELNAGPRLNYELVILKDELEAIDPEWLDDQYSLTGEIFGYVEESGCCSTSIRLQSRVRLFEPGRDQPVLTLSYPQETFFEHDYSTLEQERRELAVEVALTLAERLREALAQR